MKKTKSIILLILFFVVLHVMPVFASNGEINSIDYNILVTEDAKIEVIEVWEVNFDKDTESIVRKIPEIKGLDNVTIKEYNKDGTVKHEFERINVNSVSANKYYIKDNDIYIGIDNTGKHDKKFISIEYTILNHINVYLDCAEFDLIIQDKNFDFDSTEITGKIKFAKPIDSLAGFNTWVHSNSVSSVTKVEELSQINFYVDGNKPNKQLDIKVAFPTDMLTVPANKVIKGNRLRLIYEEEIEKNSDKTELGQKKLILNGIIITVAIVSVTLAVIFTLILIFKIKNIKKDKNKVENKLKEDDVSVELEDKNVEKIIVKNQEIETLDKDKNNKK